jgi:hypothetical protein
MEPYRCGLLRILGISIKSEWQLFPFPGWCPGPKKMIESPNS